MEQYRGGGEECASLLLIDLTYGRFHFVGRLQQKTGHGELLHPVGTASSTSAKFPPLPTPSLSPGAPLTWEGPQLSVLLFCCEENNLCCGRRVQNCSLTPVPSSCWHAQYPQVALPLLPRTKVTLGLADQGLAAAAQGSTGHGTSLVITDATKPYLCCLVILASSGAARNGKP